MPIILDCDCGKQLKARDDLAGKWVNCPACGRGLLIPLPENQAGSADELALRQEPGTAPRVPDPETYQRRWRPPQAHSGDVRAVPVITAPPPRLKSAESSWRGFVHYLLLLAMVPL